MKEGGEVWLCDLSSFTARCFILKPLIYRFSPSAAVQVIGTGEGGGGVCVKRHRLCKRLSAKLFDYKRASDHGRQSEPCCDTCGRGLRRGVIATSASLCWSDAAAPPQLQQFIMKQWARGRTGGGGIAVRVEPATPESSQLLHCCTATVCSSEESATLFHTIREADDSGGRLQHPGNYLCWVFFFFKKGF